MDDNQQVGELGWGRFLLQLLSVGFVFLAASVIPILIFGQSPTGVLASVVWGMLAALAVAWLWLRRDGVLAEAWDLSRPPNLPKTLLFGLGSSAVIAVWFSLGASLVKGVGLEAPQVEEVLGYVTASPLSFTLWVVLVSWFAAGFGEELLWRGFLFDRLKRLPGLNSQIWIALLLQALIFGLAHGYQGWGGVIITGAVGLYLGWLRIKSDWNLWACIIAHAAVDTAMMSLAYAGETGLIELAA